jgi:hypothetical protein
MTKTDDYRTKLQSLDHWDAYLLKESGLPGPRGNLELAQVVADLGSRELFFRYAALSAAVAPVNSPEEFLTFCGVVGLGRLLAEGDRSLFADLRAHANDPRWRLREAVAMALQRLGDVDMDALIAAMREWANGTLLEQRAAAAALSEPRLLKSPQHARALLQILDEVTTSIAQVKPRKRDEFTALRKGMGYCWSVAVAALPEEGKPLMEKWLVSQNVDVRWIMRENLTKNRLVRLDPQWVEKWQAQLEG